MVVLVLVVVVGGRGARRFISIIDVKLLPWSSRSSRLRQHDTSSTSNYYYITCAAIDPSHVKLRQALRRTVMTRNSFRSHMIVTIVQYQIVAVFVAAAQSQDVESRTSNLKPQAPSLVSRQVVSLDPAPPAPP